MDKKNVLIILSAITGVFFFFSFGFRLSEILYIPLFLFILIRYDLSKNPPLLVTAIMILITPIYMHLDSWQIPMMALTLSIAYTIFILFKHNLIKKPLITLISALVSIQLLSFVLLLTIPNFRDSPMTIVVILARPVALLAINFILIAFYDKGFDFESVKRKFESQVRHEQENYNSNPSTSKVKQSTYNTYTNTGQQTDYRQQQSYQGNNSNQLLLPQNVIREMPSMVRNELAKMSAQQQQEYLEEFQRIRKSTAVGYIFFLLLPFSLHYAYLKKWGEQILFTLTGGGFLIWWLIDLFRIPSMLRNYNKDTAIAVLRNMKAIYS